MKINWEYWSKSIGFSILFLQVLAISLLALVCIYWLDLAEGAVITDEAQPNNKKKCLEDALPNQFLSPRENIKSFFSQNSARMAGSVAVAVFFPESNGAIDENMFDWTSEDIEMSLENIKEYLKFLESEASRYGVNLKFQLVIYRPDNSAMSIGYEPVWRIDNGYHDEEWVNEIMKNLGFFDQNNNDGGMVNNFNSKLKEEQGTDWAFSLFVPVVSQEYAFRDRKNKGRGLYHGYRGGPYAVTAHITDFGTKSVAHETAHVFWACDEYAVRCKSCAEGCGFRNNVPNGNCESCNPAPADCVMRSSSFRTVCEFTAKQIGWLGWIEEKNNPPVADAGSDIITVSAETEINFWRSYDSDGDSIEPEWTIVEQPQGGFNLSDAEYKRCYKCTIPLQKEGVYKFRLVVSDGIVESQPDYFYIRRLGDKQKIVVETNKNEYEAGDTLELYVWVGNAGADVRVDAFIGFGLSDGSLWFLDKNFQLRPSDINDQKTFTPFAENIALPNGYAFPLGNEANADSDGNGKPDAYRLFSVALPQLPAGKYFAFAALAEAGSVQIGSPKIIGDLSIKFFEFE